MSNKDIPKDYDQVPEDTKSLHRVEQAKIISLLQDLIEQLEADPDHPATRLAGAIYQPEDADGNPNRIAFRVGDPMANIENIVMYILEETQMLIQTYAQDNDDPEKMEQGIALLVVKMIIDQFPYLSHENTDLNALKGEIDVDNILHEL